MELASWIPDSPYLTIPPWRKFLDFWHLQSDGRSTEILWGWRLTKTSLCRSSVALCLVLECWGLGPVLTWAGRCLPQLQEDGCLSSGPKHMMKGTVYLARAAACMWYFHKSVSETLTAASRWRNHNWLECDLEMAWVFSQSLLVFISVAVPPQLVSALLNDFLAGCWLSCHFDSFAPSLSSILDFSLKHNMILSPSSSWAGQSVGSRLLREQEEGAVSFWDPFFFSLS